MILDYQSLLRDRVRMNALLDSMAAFLASMLAIRNFEVAKPKLPLGVAMYEEKEHFPNRRVLELLEDLSYAYSYCVRAERLVDELRKEAEEYDNVALQPYSLREAYGTKYDFQRTVGSNVSVLTVGGVGQTLYKDLKVTLIDWLVQCDTTMCAAFEDLGGDEETELVRTEFSEFVERLAAKIGKGLCCMDPERQGVAEPLVRWLDTRAGTEMDRCSEKAIAQKKHDLEALRTFYSVACLGTENDKGHSFVEHHRAHLEYIAQTPPTELEEARALLQLTPKQLNLGLFASAIREGIDLEVSCEVLQLWYSHHGASVAAVAAEAITRLEKWDVTTSNGFVNVLRDPDRQCNVLGGQVQMPRIPVVVTERAHWFQNGGSRRFRRIGLDRKGRRVLRMVSMVRQLVAWADLDPFRGVVAAHLVHPIATVSSAMSRMAAQKLRKRHESYQMGTLLLKSIEDVSDMASHVSDQVQHSMCYLAPHSTHDVIAAFHCDSPIHKTVLRELTIRTFHRLDFAMPKTYGNFVQDTLHFVLPIFETRRMQYQVPVHQRSNVVAALLQTLPRVQNWCPHHGSLCLTQADLTGAAPLTKSVLKTLVERCRHKEVEYKRPYVSPGVKAPKLMYVLNAAFAARLFSLL